MRVVSKRCNKEFNIYRENSTCNSRYFEHAAFSLSGSSRLRLPEMLKATEYGFRCKNVDIDRERIKLNAEFQKKF